MTAIAQLLAQFGLYFALSLVLVLIVRGLAVWIWLAITER